MPLNGRGRGVGRPRGSKNSTRGRGRGYLPPAVAEGLARHEAVQQQAYHAKYKQMKKVTRSLVLVSNVSSGCKLYKSCSS